MFHDNTAHTNEDIRGCAPLAAGDSVHNTVGDAAERHRRRRTGPDRAGPDRSLIDPAARSVG